MITTQNKMAQIDQKEKIKKIIELLKFSLTADDQEITLSVIATVIEMLEELNQ